MTTKLIYITVTMPFGSAEQFFIAEVMELVKQRLEIMIVPRSPSGNIINSDAKGFEGQTLSQPLLSLDILWVAICEIVRKPLKSLQALRILFQSRTLRIFFKNLAIFPKGLWLSRKAQDWGATHIHAQWASTTASLALLTSQISGISWSFSAHRGDITENNLLKVKVRKASFVRFISQSGVEMARKLLNGQLKGKIRVIHMGVHLPPFLSNPISGDTSPVILCPARLLPVKGHTYLLKAISILKDRNINCILKIVGDGELRQALETQVKQLRLTDVVEILGNVPHDELLKFYSDHKVGMVVLPSLDLGKGNHEGIPVSLIEAMAYGVPVVSTRTGGVPELLKGEAGLLVLPKNPSSLAEAIEMLIRDKALRSQLSRKARKLVIEEFCVKDTVAKFIELLNEI